MKKYSDAISDVAVTVGSAVGVGLLSGKETQVFVRAVPNAVIFAVAFCVILTVFREYCRTSSTDSIAKLSTNCFKRFATPFNLALTACAFVCVVTCLAGVEQCLSDILYLSKFPLYAVCVAFLSAIVMARGMSALKVVNTLSLVLAGGLLTAITICRVPARGAVDNPRFYMPIVYALFNFTMSIALLCRLGCHSSKRQNMARSAISAVLIAVLLIVTSAVADFSKPLPTLSGIGNPYLLAYAVITVSLCSICGIVACALPVCELLNGLIGDKTLSSVVTFGFACAFAMFGFDFLVKFGYAFVALVGAIIVITALKSLLFTAKRSKQASR